MKLEELIIIEMIEFTDFKDFQVKVREIRKKHRKVKLEIMDGYIYIERKRYVS